MAHISKAGRIVSTVFAFQLGACTAHVTESDLLRPIGGGTLSQQVVTAAAPAYTVTRHEIVAADGARLHAVHLRQPGAKSTILYFGGNGFTSERFGAPTAAFFAPLGVDLMIVDHRGYGPSEGTPTAANMETDALAAYDYLSSLGAPSPLPVIVHGQSLGSFLAGHVAASRPTAGVVLESSVTTTEDWAKSQAAGMPIKVAIAPALKGRGNLSKMPSIAEPLLLLVGSSDKVTPIRFSEALYRASPLPRDRKFLRVIAGAGHNDVLTKPAAAAAYADFLRRVVP